MSITNNNNYSVPGIDFYTGVPDSLLQDFCGYVHDTAPASNHIISANEVMATGLLARLSAMNPIESE